jgi:hypothetical protein
MRKLEGFVCYLFGRSLGVGGIGISWIYLIYLFYMKGRDGMGLDLDNIYKYHAPKEGQTTKYEAIRAKAKELAKLIETECPASREKSIAFTQLETAIMWANAAIARS